MSVAQLDELAGRNVERPQVRARAVERHVAAHPDGMPPGADDVARRDQRGRELAEPDLPLVAPDLDVHVDDVVVGRRDPAQPVVDPEAPRLRLRSVVPHDSHALVRPRRAERSGPVRALELRARAWAVRLLSLRDRDLVERLAVAERDLAERAGKGAVELKDDHLVDEQAAVAGDLDRHVRRGQGERLGGRVPGERERRQRRDR